MTSIPDILREIRRHGVLLSPVGHRIRAAGSLASLPAGLKEQIKEHRLEIIELIMSERIPAEKSLAISNIQQRMHLGSAQSAGADHVRSVFHVEGELDEALLASAAQATVQQNPMLRSRFSSDQNEIHQTIGCEQLIQLERITIPDGGSEESAVQEFIERPFDLAEEQLLRLGMTGTPDDSDRRLVIVVHHALADGQSAGIMASQMGRNYNLLKSGALPEIPEDQLATVERIAEFQKRSSIWEEADLLTWIEEIGVGSTGSLPPCDEEATSSRSLEFGLMTRSFSPEDAAEFNRLMQQESCSLLATGLAATCIFLKHTTGNDSSVLGLAVSERRSALLENAIANLAIDIPVKIDAVNGNSFLDVIRTCQRAVLSGLERPQVPMEAMLEKGCLDAIGRRRLRLPLAIATYERRNDPIRFDGATITRLENSHPNPFIAMGIRLVNETASLNLNLEWDRTMFTDERAERLSIAFMKLLSDMLREPSRPIEEFEVDDSLKEGTILERPKKKVATDQEEQRPSSILATHLASIWSELLNIHPVQMTDRFFELGGNSLQLIRMIDRIEKTIGTRIGIGDLVGDPTLEEVTNLLNGASDELEIPPAMWLNKDRQKPQIFCIAGIGGLATFSYRGVADHLEGRASLIGIQLPGIGGGEGEIESILDIAQWVKEAIVSKAQPGTPIRIAGFSAGGIIGIEAAKLLRTDGYDVKRIILIDTKAPLPTMKRGFVRAMQHKFRQFKAARKMKRSLNRNAELDLNADTGGQLERNLASALARTRMLLIKYTTASCSEKIVLLNAEQDRKNRPRFNAKDNAAEWKQIATHEPEVIDLPYSHIEMMNSGSAAVADVLLNEIGQA